MSPTLITAAQAQEKLGGLAIRHRLTTTLHGLQF